jgi:hypothetical protein
MSLYVKESGLNRLVTKIMNHDCGTITAFREIYSLEDNKKRNKSLMAKLMSNRYHLTKVEGSYIENIGTNEEVLVKEESFFVEDYNDKGTLKKDLIKFGEEFDQDSILFIPKANKSDIKSGTSKSFLVGLNDKTFPGYLQEAEFPILKIGKDDSQFLTKVNGRPFYFQGIIEEDIYCGTINGIWGATIYSKKNWKDMVI